MHLEKATTNNKDIEKARELIQKCVHCGFCNATCPTYQQTGNELDGPRGRIYLIKSLMEGKADGKETQFHLDRCLTCRNCETTCPSGVQYGELIDVGRHYVDDLVPRSAFSSAKRKAIVATLSSNQPLSSLIKMAGIFAPLMPKNMKAQLPHEVDFKKKEIQSKRKFISLDGCAQRHLAPQINQATKRVLAELNIEMIRVAEVDCCGALHLHTTGGEDGVKAAQKAIDGFTKALDEGAEGLVMTASGCGVHIKEYAKLFQQNNPYYEKAKRIADKTQDILELVNTALSENKNLTLNDKYAQKRIVVHEPCTLQHGQKMQGALTTLLGTLGATVIPINESHLCCGSAGSYSLLQPNLSKSLKKRKLENIEEAKPDLVVSANIGCILHLGGKVTVRHWIELLAESLDS